MHSIKKLIDWHICIDIILIWQKCPEYEPKLNIFNFSESERLISNDNKNNQYKFRETFDRNSFKLVFILDNIEFSFPRFMHYYRDILSVFLSDWEMWYTRDNLQHQWQLYNDERHTMQLACIIKTRKVLQIYRLHFWKI